MATSQPLPHRAHRYQLLTPILTALAVQGGCVVDPVDLGGKECPCATGWSCETVTNTCVRQVDLGAPSADGSEAGADGAVGEDSGPTADDAQVERDAEPDATPVELPPINAGAPASSCPLPTDAGVGSLDGGEYLSCSGFERAPLATPMTPSSHSGSVVALEAGRSYAGSGALRFDITAETSAHAAVTYTMKALPAMYARGYFFLPENAPGGVWTLMFVRDGLERTRSMGVTFSGDLFSLQAGRKIAAGNGPLPRGRWVCLEIGLEFEPENTLTLWVDGEQTVSGTPFGWILEGEGADEYATVRFGLTSLGGFPATSFVDEVFVARARIGCE